MAMAVGSAVAGVFVAGGSAAVASAALSSVLISTLVSALGGAIIGAAVGALAAAVSGGDIGKGALWGAVGGAVMGGISGYLAGTASVATGVTSAGAEGFTGLGGAGGSGLEGGAAAYTSGTSGGLTGVDPTAGGGGSNDLTQQLITETLSTGIEGYMQSEATSDALEAELLEAAEAREWQSEENAKDREAAMAQLQLRMQQGSGGPGTDDKLGFAQLDETKRQFDVQRADVLGAKTAAKEALGGIKFKRAGGTSSALDQASQGGESGLVQPATTPEPAPYPVPTPEDDVGEGITNPNINY